MVDATFENYVFTGTGRMKDLAKAKLRQVANEGSLVFFLLKYYG
jgi:hypothetical protein